jgi:membrane-associated phospholipid phosphatase
MPEKKDDLTIKKIEVAAHEVARAESAPAPVRRYRVVLFQIALVIVAGSFGVLTFLVKTMSFFAIDLQVTTTMQRINFPPFALLMNLTSWPGFLPQSIVITGLIILLIYSFGLHWEAVMALFASIFSTTLNLLVKDLIQRPRPTPDMANIFSTLSSYSFPSGHVMFYFGFFGFIWFLAFTLMKKSIKRSILLGFFGSLIVLVGISRIYQGQHWASDVVGAYLLGSLTLVAIIEFYIWGKKRFFVHQPVAASEPQKT